MPDSSDADLRMLKLFNHYRHDWMNDIQILFGYVKLKKYDKLLELMEKIKGKVQQESYISKLGVPSLIMALLSFQCEVKELKLMIEMDHEFSIAEHTYAPYVEGWILGLLSVYREEASLITEEQHELTLRLTLKEEALQVRAEYSGGYRPEVITEKQEILQNAWLEPSGGVLLPEFQDGRIIWTASWPRATDT